MKAINSLCKKVLKLTTADFESAINECNKQAEYVSPLKMARQGRTNKAGNNNLMIIQKIKELKEQIEKGG